MNSITHLDGSDVVVTDCHGRFLSAVDEVRVEPDRAVIALRAARVSNQLVLFGGANYAIHSARDGHLHWLGPVRVVLV